MARPVVVVVDAEDASRQALARELELRYGAHYRIMSSASPEEALAGLEQLRGEGADVPLVLADQWMPGRSGAQFLARVRELYPTARRVLLISWSDQSAPAAVVEAAALGQIDFYLPKPVWSPDEQFHRAITEALAEWWRQQGGHFAAVTVIGKEPSARVHELRDLLARNNVPFWFHRADSEAGSAALQRLGLDQSSGPVVTLYTGVVTGRARPARRDDLPLRVLEPYTRRMPSTAEDAGFPLPGAPVFTRSSSRWPSSATPSGSRDRAP